MDREVEMQNGNCKKLGASLLRFEDAFGDIGLWASCMRPIAWALRSKFNQILVVLSTIEHSCTAGRIQRAVVAVPKQFSNERNERSRAASIILAC